MNAIRLVLGVVNCIYIFYLAEYSTYVAPRNVLSGKHLKELKGTWSLCIGMHRNWQQCGRTAILDHLYTNNRQPDIRDGSSAGMSRNQFKLKSVWNQNGLLWGGCAAQRNWPSTIQTAVTVNNFGRQNSCQFQNKNTLYCFDKQSHAYW